MPRFVALVAALLALGLLGSAGLAQEATPAAGVAAFPLTPDPAECTVEPRPVEEAVALVAQATPAAAAAAEPAETVAVPVGELADAETVAGVTATVREVYACFNAGDVARAFALVTDDVLRGFAEEDPIPEEEVRAFLGATPAAVPAAQRVAILAITDVVRLPGGRAGALVAVADPAIPEGPETIHFTFERRGDRWLIAAVVEFHTHPAEGAGTAGTPAA